MFSPFCQSPKISLFCLQDTKKWQNYQKVIKIKELTDYESKLQENKSTAWPSLLHQSFKLLMPKSIIPQFTKIYDLELSKIMKSYPKSIGLTFQNAPLGSRGCGIPIISLLLKFHLFPEIFQFFHVCTKAGFHFSYFISDHCR